MKPSSDSGSAALETVLIVPIFVALFLFAIFGGRLVGAKNHVVGAAQDAARAASQRDDPADAAAVANETGRASLRAAGLACSHSDVRVDTAQFQPGGFVRVHVSCVASLADLTSLGVPGSRTFTATATEAVDTYRSDQP
jgi:Flp pilus assembly protein TadG